MGRMLRDPDFLVTAPFLDALAVLNTPSADATWPAIRARLPFLRRQLSEALPTKRGQALATSKQTYMAGLEQLAAVKFGSDQITQIIQMVEQLSPIDQDLWLGQRWTQVSDQRWLPVLQRLALRDVNFRQPGNPELAPIVGISKLALKRWYALDLKTAREAILREISSPAPRFGADALGILPDQTLPAVQHIIAEHFVSLVAPGPTGVPPDSGLQARSSQSFPSLAATASTRAAGEPEAVRSRRPRSHQE